MSISFELNVLFIDRTMLIVLKDGFDASKSHYIPTIVGRYDYDDDRLIMEVPPDSESDIRNMCRRAFEAYQMNDALR